MNEKLTAEDFTILKNPFEVNEHEFHNGFTYITEAAITDRIEMVDPAWSFEIVSIVARGGAVTVTGRLTIKGSVRDGVGMEKVLMTKSGDKEANEAEKSAATDALKRAARLFGIGRYLLDAPKNMNMESLKSWLQNRSAPHWATNGGGERVAAKIRELGLNWSEIKSKIEPGKVLEKLSDTTLTEAQVMARLEELKPANFR